MRRAGFIGSFLSAVLGAVTLIATSVMNSVMPKIGYMIFQLDANGSYGPDDYIMNFTFANSVAAVMIIFGLSFGAYCFITGLRANRE